MKLVRLREWRESHGLTQKELAAEAHASEWTIARAEGGEEVRPNTARRLAEAMGVSVADLLERPPVPLGEAPREAGRPTIADVISDAADRQLALERQAEGPMLDQRHANEAMRRLREEYGLDGNDAEGLVELALKDARRKEENATLRDRLQERERDHS